MSVESITLSPATVEAGKGFTAIVKISNKATYSVTPELKITIGGVVVYSKSYDIPANTTLTFNISLKAPDVVGVSNVCASTLLTPLPDSGSIVVHEGTVHGDDYAKFYLFFNRLDSALIEVWTTAKVNAVALNGRYITTGEDVATLFRSGYNEIEVWTSDPPAGYWGVDPLRITVRYVGKAVYYESYTPPPTPQFRFLVGWEGRQAWTDWAELQYEASLRTAYEAQGYTILRVEYR